MNQFFVDLQFWRGIPWRRTVLLLTLAGLEMSWLTPILLAFHPRSWDRSPLIYLLGLWGIMLVMMVTAHFMSSRQIDSPMFELGIVAVIVVIGLIITRLYVFWDVPPADFTWLQAPFQPSNPRRLEVFLLLATLGYLWWRGITFLQREVGFFIIGYDFRKGVLGLVAGVLLYSSLSGQPADIFVYPFFFFSLMAVALGRVEDKAQFAEGGKQPSGPEWVGILAISSVALLSMAALFSVLWSPRGFRAVGQAMAPTGSVLGRAVQVAALFLLSLLEPFLQWLIRFIQENLPDGVQAINLQLPADAADLLGVNADGELAQTSSQRWLALIGDYLLPALIMIVALVVLVFWLERRRSASRGAGEKDLKLKTDGIERAGMGGLMAAGLDRLRDLFGMVGQYGLGRRFYAAISIRNIYANLQRLAEKRGYPRHQAQTPSDYLPSLLKAFPGLDDPLMLITNAYNAFEYGEVPTEPAELERLQSAWTSIQDAARQTEPLPRDGNV